MAVARLLGRGVRKPAGFEVRKSYTREPRLAESAHVRFGGGKSEKYQPWQLVGFLSYYNMVGKGQMRGVEKGDILGQGAWIARLLAVAA